MQSIVMLSVTYKSFILSVMMLDVFMLRLVMLLSVVAPEYCPSKKGQVESRQGILKGEVSLNSKHLLFDWFGISCMTDDNFCFYLQNRLIQTSQTGGQWYSDTPPLVFPGLGIFFLSAGRIRTLDLELTRRLFSHRATGASLCICFILIITEGVL